MKKVTVLGGGTGTYVVLSGLKKHELDLAAIVSMMDSGGSTGRLRDQLGVLPPGDLRQCLVALSEAPELWRKLFLYRFDNGDLKGHNFGNIFLSALEKVSDDYHTVMDTANYVLQTKGDVLPVTTEKTHLKVEYENGSVLIGEGIIDEDNPERSRIATAQLEPPVSADKESMDRIADSDYIIIGPGDLYTSIVPVLLVKGISEALQKTKAKIIFIVNLMTKSGQTTNYTAKDFLEDITKYLGRSPDYLISNNGPIPEVIKDWYKSHDEIPVKLDITPADFNGTIIEEDVISKNYNKKNLADSLTRSILRHKSEKLTEVLMKII